LFDAEHLELALVPTADNVEADAPLADVIGGNELLRGNNGMNKRRVYRSEDNQSLGLGKQARGPTSMSRAWYLDNRYRRHSLSIARWAT
jgi:hypothetical protein